ncbi:hypothetical protein F4703DRAFT_1924829 [Phycomyces blakesleeanus]
MAIILSSVYNYHKWSSRTISNGCPRVPHTLPFFGLTKVYRKDSKAFCEEWHVKLGPVFRAHLFGKEVTVVSGHYVREVFLNKHFDFIKGIVKVFDTRLLTDNGSREDFPPEDLREIITKYLTPKLNIYTRRLIKQLKQDVENILVVEYRLSEARRNPDWKKPTDVLQDLLENSKPPAHMDLMDYLVCIITILIFVALHSTIENTTVLLYRILENPEIMDELDLEQREVIEQEGLDTNCGSELFTRDILKKFTKLDSVCRETFRMKNQYITLPHEYDGKVPLTLSNGAVINPGDDVLIDVWTNHRYKKETTSVKDADEFRPFRFVNQNKQSTKVGEDYLFFGMGRHACPGRWFAMQEIQAITAILVRECKFIPKGPIIFPTAERSPIPTGRCIIQRK